MRKVMHPTPVIQSIFAHSVRPCTFRLSTGTSLFTCKFIYIYIHTYIHTQIIIQDSEDKLQKSVYVLNQMSEDYNLKVSKDKTKIMVFTLLAAELFFLNFNTS